MRMLLVPVCNRGDVVLQRQVAAFRAPADGLHGYAQVAGKADGIHDVKAVQAVPVPRLAFALDPHRIAQVGRGVGIPKTPCAAEIVLGTCAAERRKRVVAVHEKPKWIRNLPIFMRSFAAPIRCPIGKTIAFLTG